jgi:hypothetical protein
MPFFMCIMQSAILVPFTAVSSHFNFHLISQQAKTTTVAGFQHGSFLPQGQDCSCCFWREQKGAMQQGEVIKLLISVYSYVTVKELVFILSKNLNHDLKVKKAS